MRYLQIILLYALISTPSYAQDLDSLMRNPMINSNLVSKVNSIYWGKRYNCVVKNSTGQIVAYGHYKGDVAKGSWVFLENEGKLVTGRYKNGNQHGRWDYVSGNWLIFRNGQVRKAKLIY